MSNAIVVCAVAKLDFRTSETADFFAHFKRKLIFEKLYSFIKLKKKKVDVHNFPRSQRKSCVPHKTFFHSKLRSLATVCIAALVVIK